uniref:5'-nucleotidase n=1 Tax=Ixodes scapularis TaxID=6945 RepID=A0A1S4M5W4_IXOSC
MDKYRPQLQAARSRIVAATYVYLQGDRKTLRFGESNMGNVMAEAFLKYLAKRIPRRSGFWSSVSAVIINSGSLRTSILEGIITFEDVVNVLPFGDSISLVNMTGAQLKGVLEHGVRRYDVKGVKKRGEFLQMAGMRVVYNVYREPRHRVIDLQILCTACRVPRFERVKDHRIYSIGTAKYIAHGGDEFNFSFLKPRDHVDTSFLAVEVAAEYLNASSPVTMGLDGRIAFVK